MHVVAIKLALVGAFVYFAAGSEERQVRIRSRVDRHIAMDLMEPAHHIFGATTAPEDVVQVARRAGAAMCAAIRRRTARSWRWRTGSTAS